MKKVIPIIFIALLAIINFANGQWYTTGNNLSGTEYLGGDNTSNQPLRLKTITNYPIDFYVNNNYFLSIIAGTSRAGDLDIINPTNGYEIGDWTANPPTNNLVLWHNGITSNIYVGVGAGNTHSTFSNTFMGYNAGINSGNSSTTNWDGSRNTFVGHAAGASNDYGHENSFFGDSAGYSNIGRIAATGIDSGGYRNTFIGTCAGFSNLYGKSNTYVGFKTGYFCLGDYNTMTGRAAGFRADGTDNCYYGKDAAQDITGSNNCYYGAHAGDNVVTSNFNSVFGNRGGEFSTGNGNCFYGHNSGSADPLFPFSSTYNTFFGYETGRGHSGGNPIASLNYSSAIGANALVNSDGKIIIGSNLNPLNSQPIHVGIGLSDDTYAGGPRSQLELNTDPAMSVSGVTGSGLQFRQLISTSPLNINTYLAPYGKVLTVDADGKVKLTDGGTGFGYGICTNYAVLPADIGMNFKDHRIYYMGQGYTASDYDMKNAIGIGYECDNPLPAKLSVDQSFTAGNVDVPTIAGYFHNGDITTSGTHLFPKRGIFSICDGISLATDRDETWNFGGDFVASNSKGLNIAVRGITNSHSPEYFGRVSMGGWFEGNGSSQFNFGVYTSTDSRGSINFGLYAYTVPGTCNNGGPCYDAAAYFGGDTYIEGTDYHYSDVALKDNIQPLHNAIAIINLLKPQTYTFRNNQFPNMNLPHGQQSGLIAQDVKSVVPELVSSMKVPPHMDSLGVWDTTGTGSEYLALNYIGIIPYLIAGMNEQQQTIDTLHSQLIQLRSQVDKCCNSGVGFKLSNPNEENENRSTHKVELSDITTIILNQNTPNPFSEETFINYTVPKEVSKAIIMIYDNSGQVLKTVTISERGEGSLHVYSEKLSSGIYSYSLIADGKTIDSKQMLCQK